LAKEGKWVFKAGRTTGPTIGQHGSGAIVHMYEGQTLRTKTTEPVILPLCYDMSGDPTPVLNPGDSGALIYDTSDALGLFWGGMKQETPSLATLGSNDDWNLELVRHSEKVNISDLRFYTPIDAVIESILSDLDQAYGKGNFKLFWGTSGRQLR
jgi:hypothetical protein